MTKFTAKVDGVEREIEAPTGDYRLVCAMAVAMADAQLPARVKIWVEELLPDYGPYTYLVQNESRFGWLVVTTA